MGESDPIRSGAAICAVVGVLDLLAAALLVSLGVSQGLGGLIALEGLLYLALGGGILLESRACAFVAATLYTLTTMSLVSQGLAPMALVVRAVLAWRLWQAASRIADLKALDRVAEERRRAVAEGRDPLDRRTARVAPPPVVAGPRPSARLRDVATLTMEHRRHTRVCVRCDREYPLRTLRCEACRVQLFDA